MLTVLHEWDHWIDLHIHGGFIQIHTSMKTMLKTQIVVSILHSALCCCNSINKNVAWGWLCDSWRILVVDHWTCVSSSTMHPQPNPRHSSTCVRCVAVTNLSLVTTASCHPPLSQAKRVTSFSESTVKRQTFLGMYQHKNCKRNTKTDSWWSLN